LGIVGYQRQGILDAEKTLAAAVGYLVVLGEVMYLTEMLPIILLILWQHEDDFEWRVESGELRVMITPCPEVVFPEPHDGAHQDGQTAYLNELLGHIRTHAQSFSSA
jgi:hypothetical protein